MNWHHAIKKKLQSFFHGFHGWLSITRKTTQAIGMITIANLLGSVFGVIGSLVQARFISPETLGFVRKYSVVSGYTVFLTLGLFIILRRDYPMLVGQGEHERARHMVAIVRSWCLLVCSIVCGVLLVMTFRAIVNRHFLEAGAWFIQVVSVWSSIYVGYISSVYTSVHEFTRLAKGQLISSFSSVAILPLFFILPYPTLVARSVIGSILNSLYLITKQPMTVRWSFPWREFLDLVKRGLRLFASDYTRFFFWLTVEIWLVYDFAGDSGVGLFTFGRLIAETGIQATSAIGLVFLPRLAQRYGESGSARDVLRYSFRPTLLSLGVSLSVTIACWVIVPPFVMIMVPTYVGAIPLAKILIFQTILASLHVPLYVLTIKEKYLLLFLAAVAGLAVLVGASLVLRSLPAPGSAVAWGSLAGQTVFTTICYLGLALQQRREQPEHPR